MSSCKYMVFVLNFFNPILLATCDVTKKEYGEEWSLVHIGVNNNCNTVKLENIEYQ